MSVESKGKSELPPAVRATAGLVRSYVIGGAAAVAIVGAAGVGAIWATGDATHENLSELEKRKETTRGELEEERNSKRMEVLRLYQSGVDDMSECIRDLNMRCPLSALPSLDDAARCLGAIDYRDVSIDGLVNLCRERVSRRHHE